MLRERQDPRDSTMNTKYQVTGIGNAIVDVLAQADDQFLVQNEIQKGGMTLIDTARADKLYDAMTSPVEASGGSAANTLAGIASLGGNAAYIGKVAEDKLGQAFTQDIRSIGTHFTTPALQGSTPTARCLIFVTPDAQRSMNTFLGACVELGPEDLDQEVIQSSQVTYLEGYLWDRPKAKEAFLSAAKIAHEASRKVSLSLSDAFCVDRHRDSFLSLIEGHVDILFANEAEIKSLYQTESLEEAMKAVSGHCEIAVITQSEKGSSVLVGEQRFDVPAAAVEKVVDTTGAGDLYAAGFLFGYCQGKSPADCARIGSIAAAEVISHFGARPLVDLKTLLPADLA